MKKNGQVMSLEYTKHMADKDLHRNLTCVRDILTFAALPVDETTQQTSQNQTAVQNELSVGSDRSGVIAKDLFKSSFCQL